jgi:hypothetical protein
MQPIKSIVVKLYLDPDTYLDTKAKCDASGISMSSAGNLALRQWQPAHISRRRAANDMPAPGPNRAYQLPGARRAGAPVRHMRV